MEDIPGCQTEIGANNQRKAEAEKCQSNHEEQRSANEHGGTLGDEFSDVLAGDKRGGDVGDHGVFLVERWQQNDLVEP